MILISVSCKKLKTSNAILFPFWIVNEVCIVIDLMNGWHNGNEGVVKLCTVLIPPLPSLPQSDKKKKKKSK